MGNYAYQHGLNGASGHDQGETYGILTERWSSIANAQEIGDVRLCIKVSLVSCITKIHAWRCHIRVYGRRSAHHRRQRGEP